MLKGFEYCLNMFWIYQLAFFKFLLCWRGAIKFRWKCFPTKEKKVPEKNRFIYIDDFIKTVHFTYRRVKDWILEVNVTGIEGKNNVTRFTVGSNWRKWSGRYHETAIYQEMKRKKEEKRNEKGKKKSRKGKGI